MQPTECAIWGCLLNANRAERKNEDMKALENFLQLWPLVRAIEQSLQEKFSPLLIERLGSQVFLSGSPLLTPEHNAQIRNANIELRRQSLDSPEAVAKRLGFGFWRYLLAKRYESLLWAPALQHSFSSAAPKDRKLIEKRIREASVLRNQLAHHEHLGSGEVDSHLSSCFELLSWLSPTRAEGLRRSTFYIFYT